MTLPRKTLALTLLLLGLTTTLAQSPTPPTSAPSITAATSTTSAPATNKVAFLGVNDHATRIVFVVGSSLSMLDVYESLRTELKLSINALDENQSVCVITVPGTDDIHSLVPDGKPVPATQQAKKDLCTAIDQSRPTGQSEDRLLVRVKAFRAAMAAQPDVIFFVAIDPLPPNLVTELVQELGRLNRLKNTRIHTVAFTNKQPSLTAELLMIAKNNGGHYTFVDAKDLKPK